MTEPKITANRSRLLRMRGLLKKEFLQIRRDPSSIILAVIMPIVLLILLGYGVSLNPTDVPVGWVDGARSSKTRDFRARLEGSEYFDLHDYSSIQAAEQALQNGQVDAVVFIREDFLKRLAASDGAPISLLLDGVNSNQAALIWSYVNSALSQWSAIQVNRGEAPPSTGVTVEHQIWFNASSDSHYFLVPGLIALIMTVIGTLLTALVIAREWERGTMEAILATPLRRFEFLMGKTIPYFILGMIGFLISLAGSTWLFHVPIRGSLWLVMLASALYLTTALGLGLALSAKLRVQFVAAQVSIVIGFLPTFFLSGMLYDLGSAPVWIQWVSRFVPASYFVKVSHTLFLAGDLWGIVIPTLSALGLASLLFFFFAWRNLKLRIDS
ncbi:ABC transporter permease [Coraliomargarita sp. W4R53]